MVKCLYFSSYKYTIIHYYILERSSKIILKDLIYTYYLLEYLYAYYF